MWKQNKWKIIISSAITLLPMVFGLIFWDKLPAQMATHWGPDGTVNGTSSTAFAVFGLPLILVVFYWICLWITSLDPKSKGQNKKALNIVFWIIPAISLFTSGMMYASAFGMEFDVFLLMPILLGLMFIVIGNYLPKCTQNFTLGIKVKWTLENEENWNATHRFGGKVWVIGGLILLFSVFLPQEFVIYVVFLMIIPLAFIPAIYSYVYYRKQMTAGTYKRDSE